MREVEKIHFSVCYPFDATLSKTWTRNSSENSWTEYGQWFTLMGQLLQNGLHSKCRIAM